MSKNLKVRPDPITIKIRKDVDNDKYYIRLGSSAEETFDFPDPQSIVQLHNYGAVWIRSSNFNLSSYPTWLGNRTNRRTSSSSPLTINDSSEDRNKETNNIISIEKKEVTNEERLEIATQLFPGFSEFLS
nr:7852_t:CDS:2 [Entrophospora candida]